jgi:hypothetical protein
VPAEVRATPLYVTPLTVVVFRPLIFMETPTTIKRLVPVVVWRNVREFPGLVRVSCPLELVTESNATCACAVGTRSKHAKKMEGISERQSVSWLEVPDGHPLEAGASLYRRTHPPSSILSTVIPSVHTAI